MHKYLKIPKDVSSIEWGYRGGNKVQWTLRSLTEEENSALTASVHLGWPSARDVCAVIRHHGHGRNLIWVESCPDGTVMEPFLWTVAIFCQFCVESCVHMIWWGRCNERGVNRKQVLMPPDSHTYYAQRMLAIQCEIQFLVSRRVTSVVAFGFLPQMFGNVAGSYECYFVTLWLQVEWSGHSEATQTLLAQIEKFEHFAPTGDRGCKNISLMPESPGETFTIFKPFSLLLKMIKEFFFENAKTPSNSLSLGTMWISLWKKKLHLRYEMVLCSVRRF